LGSFKGDDRVADWRRQNASVSGLGSLLRRLGISLSRVALGERKANAAQRRIGQITDRQSERGSSTANGTRRYGEVRLRKDRRFS
jgi:hypothetical protein